jgi:hypothetical protein
MTMPLPQRSRLAQAEYESARQAVESAPVPVWVKVAFQQLRRNQNPDVLLKTLEQLYDRAHLDGVWQGVMTADTSRIIPVTNRPGPPGKQPGTLRCVTDLPA